MDNKYSKFEKRQKLRTTRVTKDFYIYLCAYIVRNTVNRVDVTQSTTAYHKIKTIHRYSNNNKYETIENDPPKPSVQTATSNCMLILKR